MNALITKPLPVSKSKTNIGQTGFLRSGQRHTANGVNSSKCSGLLQSFLTRTLVVRLYSSQTSKQKGGQVKKTLTDTRNKMYLAVQKKINNDDKSATVSWRSVNRCNLIFYFHRLRPFTRITVSARRLATKEHKTGSLISLRDLQANFDSESF